jgi:hypothetical protein
MGQVYSIYFGQYARNLMRTCARGIKGVDEDAKQYLSFQKERGKREKSRSEHFR